MDDSLKVAMEVKNYVKKYLELTGKKQGFLAKEIGYNEKMFSMKINGRSPISIDDLTKLCRFFSVPASEFIK
jgi:transcriptional regulator with XRE-family HTH domain